MVIMKHELRQGVVSLAVWSLIVGMLMAVCIFIYPSMEAEMAEISDAFGSMGSFSTAFGMDKVSFSSLAGYYAVECGNILALSGAFYASITAASSLAKEEAGKTAEFLLSHPIKRARVISEKLVSVFVQVILFNAVIFAIAILAVIAVREELPLKEIGMLHLALLLLQLQLASLCFAISSCGHKNAGNIGLGLSVLLYFINIISNLFEKAECLKLLTPFGYAEGAAIVADQTLDGKLIAVGMVYGILAIVFAYRKYTQKDIC